MLSAPPPTAQAPVAWGDTLEVNPRESIGGGIWRNAVYDIALSEAIVRLLPRSGVAIDVGANLGYATCLMARVVGPGGAVTAFEPSPQLFERLATNVSTNGHARTVQLFEAAVSDTTGEATLALPRADQCNEGLASLSTSTESPHSVSVKAVTLDQVVTEDRIDLVKIDIEGHEAAALRGADRILREKRCRYVLFEEHRGRDAESIEILRSAGFHVFELGWTLFGPRVLPLDKPSGFTATEAPNYLATVDPEQVARLMKPRGFRCLRPC